MTSVEGPRSKVEGPQNNETELVSLNRTSRSPSVIPPEGGGANASSSETCDLRSSTFDEGGPAPNSNHALSSRCGAKERNEDAVGVHLSGETLATSKGSVVVIADGVSAASFGAEASNTAAASFIADYLSTPASWQIKTAALKHLRLRARDLYRRSDYRTPMMNS